MSKKTIKNVLSVILAVIMAVSVMTFTVSAADELPASGAEYATVFIHGLFGWGEEDGLYDLVPYWGLTAGNYAEYIEKNGYEVYAASVGPLSSAHDRCCEVFAQLTGTRVDYGQAHADKITDELTGVGSSLSHDRYGRDYTGKAQIDGWGPIYDGNGKVTGWYDSKINLVGHSFGGPTALEFTHLLAEGDEDEIAWGKAQAAANGGDWHDYVSPLFWGDYNGQFLVNSVTSIAGVLNGTTFITANDDLMDIAEPLVTLIASLTGDTDINKLYDFQLEQFGITELPGEKVKSSISTLQSLGFTKASDNAFYDLTTEGTNILKADWNTFDNIYYFSYSCDDSFCAGGANMPYPDMLLPLIPFSAVMGAYHSAGEIVLNIDGTVYGSIDSAWQANDGMLNTVSARYPFGAPHKEYNVNSIESGVWNVHPDMKEDHFSIIGGSLIPQIAKTKKLFVGIIGDIQKTKPVFDDSKVNVGAQANKLPTPQITSIRRTLLKKASLDWKSVGLCRYEIYRSTSQNGEYDRIDTTLLTSYTDLSARSGKTYYYKVVAVPLSGKAADSEFSSPVSVKL